MNERTRVKAKKKKLKAVIHERHRSELTLDQWRLEEAEMAKLTTFLSSQREMKAREATKVCARVVIVGPVRTHHSARKSN